MALTDSIGTEFDGLLAFRGVLLFDGHAAAAGDRDDDDDPSFAGDSFCTTGSSASENGSVLLTALVLVSDVRWVISVEPDSLASDDTLVSGVSTGFTAEIEQMSELIRFPCPKQAFNVQI